MSFIFVKQDAELTVNLAAGVDKSNIALVYADNSRESLLKNYPDVDPASVEQHKVFFRYPNFGDASKILDRSVDTSNDGFQFNISSIRLNKMITLITKWTFKGDNGEISAPTPELVKKLHPSVANVIGIELDSALGNSVAA